MYIINYDKVDYNHGVVTSLPLAPILSLSLNNVLTT